MAYITAIPVQLQVGLSGLHFKAEDGTWYGVGLDVIPKLVWADMVRDAYVSRSPITFELNGNRVGALPEICGEDSVPEVGNLNRGFTPPES